MARSVTVRGAVHMTGERPILRTSTPRVLKLAVIGTAAGLFSGLFGVGGGTVIVPLLVLWLGYGEHEATGTSLAAIVFIAGFAAAVQARYGMCGCSTRFDRRAAVAGVLLGTWLQQRLDRRVDRAVVRLAACGHRRGALAAMTGHEGMPA